MAARLIAEFHDAMKRAEESTARFVIERGQALLVDNKRHLCARSPGRPSPGRTSRPSDSKPDRTPPPRVKRGGHIAAVGSALPARIGGRRFVVRLECEARAQNCGLHVKLVCHTG